MTQTLFISDLHLTENQPAITEIFINFLDNCHSAIDAIYILGDLFEAWIGDDDLTPFHKQILDALKTTIKNDCPIYLLHGNRDFLIGKNFLRYTGCQLLPDETVISLYQTPILLMHGDTLCTNDIAYLKTRKILRKPWLMQLFLFLPLFFRRKIADKMRNKSMQYTASTDLSIMDVSQTAVEDIMQKYNVNYLIHGHTHQPNTHEWLIQQNPKTRIVLGAWHNRASILTWHNTGEKNLSI